MGCIPPLYQTAPFTMIVFASLNAVVMLHDYCYLPWTLLRAMQMYESLIKVEISNFTSFGQYPEQCETCSSSTRQCILEGHCCSSRASRGRFVWILPFRRGRLGRIVNLERHCRESLASVHVIGPGYSLFHLWIAIREDPIIRSVSALLRFGLIARASFGGKVSSLSSMFGWFAGTIIVPLDFRELRRGRFARLLAMLEGFDSTSSPSDVVVEVCIESVLLCVGAVIVGCAMDGTGAIGLLWG